MYAFYIGAHVFGLYCELTIIVHFFIVAYTISSEQNSEDGNSASLPLQEIEVAQLDLFLLLMLKLVISYFSRKQTGDST